MLLFVDDTQNYLHCPRMQINETIGKLNTDAQALVDWAKSSGLQLNASKTQAEIIASPHNLKLLGQTDINPIIVDNTVIPFTNCVKNLGLQISSDIKWDTQIANIITQTNKSIYFMYSKCQNLSIPLKKQIASQLLFPHFDYACINFYDLSLEQESSLQKQLNKAVRFIFKLPKHQHITPFLKKLNWLPLKSRREYFLITQTFKVLKTKTPLYLYELLKPHIIQNLEKNSMSTRSREIFRIPYKTKKIYDNSFCMLAMQSWNKLPKNIRDIEKLDSFKAAVKKMLLNNFKNS